MNLHGLFFHFIVRVLCLDAIQVTDRLLTQAIRCCAAPVRD